ncbi:sensor histidine kinase [Paenibacillus sp. 23TSA30-6]|uniref:sensor histidine kinase n=1 Tax=Paenibacillus sp. 23TSA30-6 TaxID=2546104 RepID=UPI0017881152|nr:sensor histidine kinase [Paenibacillus sp. 23TSA30-6]
MARIISHLGERLISSSKVALLELIKNSYDAKSKFIEITIDQNKRELVIYDEGHGMDNKTIEDNWLVVGTANRLNNKEDQETDDIPLGEKGLGRFSTMKLGNYLVLETSMVDSREIWKLEVDWSSFGYKSNKFLDEIENKLYSEPKKELGKSFTKITIRNLKDFVGDDWDEMKINEFIFLTAGKYINPFLDLPRTFEIKLVLINKHGKVTRSKVGDKDLVLFRQAHHEIEGKYDNGKITYGYVVRRKGQVVESGKDAILLDSKNVVLDKDQEGYIGNFSFRFFVFNRSRLKEITGFENTSRIREVLNRYTGGPMIFRDGFRIFPYGESSDDWLELNKQKFRKGRTSIIGEQTAGYISLNSNKSPFLVDQTNREGLVNNRSYENFRQVILNVFWTLLQILIRNDPKETSKTITQTARDSVLNIESVVNKMQKSGRITDNEVKLIINDSKKIEKGIKEIKRREQALVETAAIGMTSMQIAHEIHNFLHKIMSILYQLKEKSQSSQDFDLLEMNLKSLRTMVSQIDEQAVTLRRAKSSVNLVKELQLIANTMRSVVEKSETAIKISVKCNLEQLRVKVNKGLLIQLFDNLILNSIYWIDSLKPSDGTNLGRIEVEIYEDGTVLYYDNGPGISKNDAEAIFEPFFSRKEGGKGLGLFISREIAAFHNISFELQDMTNSLNRFYCFKLDFSRIVEDR